MFSKCSLCFVMFFIINNCKIQSAESKVHSTRPESYPYHAAVYEPKNNRLCSGVLISEEYVLTRASCVKDYGNASVFLGYRRKPTFRRNRKGKGIQEIPMETIIIHDHFDKPKTRSKDIALIKMQYPADLTSTVQMAEFGSDEDFVQINKKEFNVTGFYRHKDTAMKWSQVQIPDQKICSTLYGGKFNATEEICVKWEDKNILDAPGNALSFHGKVLGLSVPSPKCRKKRLDWKEFRPFNEPY